MKLFRKKILKLGNKGMSMVELICGITMLSIIGTSISGVLMVSADAYNRGTSEASVQQEAQMVANQINDLLIDATSDVTFSYPTLTIDQGDKRYTVTHYSGTKELWYQETTLDASGNPVSASEAQLMAEGVETFNVDDSKYESNGHARLDIGLVNSDQNYPSVFSVTARNKEAGDETAVVAAINLPTEIILEPGEEYTFSPTVTGLSDTSLDWSVVNATDGGGTTINDHGVLEIGANETKDMIRVLVASEQKDVNNVPMAQRYVNVYIRRIDAIDITDVLKSGLAFSDTAVYRLTAVTTDFSNLDPWTIEGTTGIKPYKDPFKFDWVIKEGADLCSITENNINCDVDLSTTMVGGDKIVIQAVALHPTNGAYNKSGEPYKTDVVAEWTLRKTSKFIAEGGGWMRQTNQAQANVSGEIDTLKANLKNDLGLSSTPYHVFEFRYKPTDEENWVVTDGVSDDDGWHPNIYGGDANNSMSINLRPLFTSTMDYRKDYNVQIRIRILDSEGNELWPTRAVGDSTDLNMVSNVVKRVQLTFDSDALDLEAALGNSESSAPTVKFDGQRTTVELLKIHEVIGIDTNGTAVDNSFVYTLEKKVDGVWVPYTGNMNIENQGTGTYKMGFGGSDFPGLYRIKVGLKNMPCYSTITNVSHYMDYVLWNEETGEGIYYFKAEQK